MNQITDLSNPLVDFNSDEARRHRRVRSLKDRLARWSVAVGGIGVIVAILLIFLYLLYEVVPLFKGAEMEPVASYPAPARQEGSQTLYLAMEEQAELALRLDSSGTLLFFSTQDGVPRKSVQLPLPEGAEITSMAEADPNTREVAVGLSNGQVIMFKHSYQVSYPNDVRWIEPQIEFPYGEQPITLDEAGAPLTQLALRDNENSMMLAASTEAGLHVTLYNKEIDFLTEEVTLERETLELPALPGVLSRVLIDPEQRWLFVALGANRMAVLDVRDRDEPVVNAVLPVTEGGGRITDIEFLLGGTSLLIGDSQGRISQWFLVRDDDNKYSLQKVRDFELASSPIVAIAPEHRRKGFMAADSEGRIGLYNTTAHRTLLVEQSSSAAIEGMTIAPRANGLLLELGGGQMEYLALHNEHPEISWSALWDKVWYEHYSEPEYVWQSSASTNDFEPKMSLMPLAFGTLKAAFYAMLLATPLAICGAIYTAYFMAPAMRRKVKPVIELMEALPTVILGFLAGLWLAPFVEESLPGIFALLILVPVAILLFGFAWAQLPERLRSLVPEGWQALLLIPVILVASALALGASGHIEVLLFDGNMRHWISSELGLNYDQRNALVVGLAMGFAVIPTIFSITEDAIFSVPKHLSYGSLALGATPWQTLTRVVLLTASPGIFSAVMIGMGRAVGETMIVLMATGNTPIMDANIFEGMRTLAANIAVEMPESEVGSSHYRVLFLAAMVLFLFTFVVNTFAEMVRHRLRKKYSSL
ncbi:ABC transporter permease subunit [Aestuariirhabdus litorea]|uniref:ABC transporter permease subunit n=1 Tax=Aestuariirhabdus litorea TaxID=2528527 RepID=A0A3P3VJL4_9GAMM|nr:ABC transporter permease subunit [Aestuariirhabdus litorea]RRJ82507.1 ABC transporter permease subunit [Aestuariirhabdus litorea]RWW92668.1 ABC transporter permease subunit [Endozoicomonadaceae bacterium GTF-13]